MHTIETKSVVFIKMRNLERVPNLYLWLWYVHAIFGLSFTIHMGRHRHESNVSAPHQIQGQHDSKRPSDAIIYTASTTNVQWIYHTHTSTAEQRSRWRGQTTNTKKNLMLNHWCVIILNKFRLEASSPVLCSLLSYIFYDYFNDLSYVHAETRSLDENKVCSTFMLFHLLSAPRFRIYILNSSDGI